VEVEAEAPEAFWWKWKWKRLKISKKAEAPKNLSQSGDQKPETARNSQK
jgi:hypothetical protein